MSSGLRFRLALSLFLVVLLPGLQGQQPLRVATWNVQSLGSPGSTQWNELVAGLNRVGADVVAIQEIDAFDVSNVGTLASQAGYPHFVVASTTGTMTGGLRNAVFSQHPIVFSASHGSASISGDPAANDITRDILEVHVQVPGAAAVTAFFVMHLKAGWGSVNDFRRAVEIQRLSQVWNVFRTANPGAVSVILGDFNDDVDDGPFGIVFNSPPSSNQLPSTYHLGNDISFPLVYDPFATFTNQGAFISDATHEDSTTLYLTRPSSGRRLDYILLEGGGVQVVGDEVYNSVRDNGVDDPPVGNWLPKWGAPLPSGSSADASDHLPVFGDLTLGSGPPAPPSAVTPGDVVVSEYMNNPNAVFDSVGEWIELFNTTGHPIDLAGYVIRDQDSDTFTLPSLVIPSRGRVVLGRNGDPAQNGGVNVDFVWPSGSFILANGFDEIEVVHPSGLVLDSVVYDNGATFPDPTGHSVERKDVTALPWASNFGESTNLLPSGDFGTPGATNSLSTGPLFTSITITGSLTPGSQASIVLDGGAALAGRSFVLGASECTQPGLLLPVSGRMLDLCLSDLFYLSVTPGNPFFSGFTGALDASGQAFPFVNIPNVPGISGLSLFLSGVVIDPLYYESVASVMDLEVLTVN